jgi:hypothetical protein
MSDSRVSRGVKGRSDFGGELDGVDRGILEYLACHPLVLFDQVMKLAGVDEVDTGERLGVLEARGMIRSGPRLRHQRGVYQITSGGLVEIGSELPVPGVDLRCYWHDIVVAWLGLAVRRGMFGPVDRVYTEREMCIADERAAARPPSIDPGWSEVARAKAADALFRLTLAAPGLPAFHYPDLVLVLPEVGRFAMEFHWEAPKGGLLDVIFDAYARKMTVAAMVFFYIDPVIGDRIRAASTAHGLDDRTRVEKVSFDL